jgi:hypothetical protein
MGLRPFPSFRSVADRKTEAINAEPYCHYPGCANLTNLTAVELDRELVVLCRSCASRQEPA